jgi:phosphate butyryltransferase
MKRWSVKVLDKTEDGGSLATTVTRVSDDADPKARPSRKRQGGSIAAISIPGLVVQRHRHFEALLNVPACRQRCRLLWFARRCQLLGGAMLAARESIIAPILCCRAAATALPLSCRSTCPASKSSMSRMPLQSWPAIGA